MIHVFRRSSPEVFLGKGVLKICSKFTGEHSYRKVNWIKLQSNFIQITLRHRCSPVNLLYNYRAPLYKNIYEGLLLMSYKVFIQLLTKCFIIDVWQGPKNTNLLDTKLLLLYFVYITWHNRTLLLFGCPLAATIIRMPSNLLLVEAKHIWLIRHLNSNL